MTDDYDHDTAMICKRCGEYLDEPGEGFSEDSWTCSECEMVVSVDVLRR